jgi:hypothetical protein
MKRKTSRRYFFAAFLLLAGYLLFAHGCHGDEDNELLSCSTRELWFGANSQQSVGLGAETV